MKGLLTVTTPCLRLPNLSSCHFAHLLVVAVSLALLNAFMLTHLVCD